MWCRVSDVVAASVGKPAGRGKSGLHRAGCLLTAGCGDAQESVTESRPPASAGKGARAV